MTEYEPEIRNFLVKVVKTQEAYFHVRSTNMKDAEEVAINFAMADEIKKRNKLNPFEGTTQFNVRSIWDFTPGNEKFLPEDSNFYVVPEGYI